MGFIFGLAFIALIVIYGFWLFRAVRDLIPKIKHKLSELKAKKQNKNKQLENREEQ